ncbi:fibrobacter succinogenes major paralogous domain-containing protein [Ekhidna sp.]|uniref:fibrobacter succinogenes major paralogous domain-containing protein n=1 Tax=Ekhidna sp. TaxID=2608089 RepID=UPI003298A430
MNIKLFLTVVILILTVGSCSDSNEFVKIDPEVTWNNPLDIGLGVPLSSVQLNATADLAGTFLYAPEIGTILEIGTNQELTVKFIPKYSNVFNEVTKTVFINVIDKGTSDANFNQSLEYGLVADIDGNAYRTITIGDQTWMAQNLRTTKYRNGDEITNITSNSQWSQLTSESYSSYNNTDDLNYIATYGLLYNWHAVADNRNIAPLGWHVATQGDWDELINTIGGVSVVGERLKESGNAHWVSGSQSSNSSGFTALPTGRRQYGDGTFINSGFNGFWWSNTANGIDYSFYYQLNFDSNPIVAANFLRASGYAVRCVKDRE